MLLVQLGPEPNPYGKGTQISALPPYFVTRDALQIWLEELSILLKISKSKTIEQHLQAV